MNWICMVGLGNVAVHPCYENCLPNMFFPVRWQKKKKKVLPYIWDDLRILQALPQWLYTLRCTTCYEYEVMPAAFRTQIFTWPNLVKEKMQRVCIMLLILQTNGGYHSIYSVSHLTTYHLFSKEMFPDLRMWNSEFSVPTIDLSLHGSFKFW